MADKILMCAVEKDIDENTIRWHVSYNVESGSKQNEFCVCVEASEMTDSTSQTEAINKANIKAKSIKDLWITSLPSNTNEITIDEPQDVTLQ